MSTYAPHNSKNNVDGVEGIQRTVTKIMIKVLKYLPYEERLKEKGLFTLEKGRLGGHITVAPPVAPRRASKGKAGQSRDPIKG